MEALKNNLLLKRALEHEILLCVQANRLCQYIILRKIFVFFSITGNGPFWYVLILAIPIIYGTQNTFVSLRMTVAGLTGLLIYKSIKHYTLRLRPYTRHSLINLGTPALDKYSFPSGHTLHAVSFTIIASHYIPGIAWILVPITGMIASSRVILGLHYPTDVFAGVVIGTSVATVIINV
ncbi:MAG: phosphatase PAP2 family protein [Thiohalomonadales bacterium]